MKGTQTLLFTFMLALSLSSQAGGSNIKQLNEAIRVDDKAQISKLLKSVGVNAQDDEGMTPLMNAAQEGNIPVLKEILKLKPQLEIKNKVGDTALAIAVGGDQIEATKILIGAGANVDITVSGENSDTLLIAAARSNAEAARLILEKNKSLVNKTNKLGETALMESVKFGYNDIAKILLKYGADTTMKNREGKSAADLAKSYHNHEALKLLTAKK